MAQESKTLDSNTPTDRTHITVAIIGAVSVLGGALIAGFFTLSAAQIAERTSPEPGPIVTSEPGGGENINPEPRDSRPIAVNWSLLMPIAGGVFFIAFIFWITLPGIRFRQKYLGYDPAENDYQHARSYAIRGDHVTAVSWLGYALKWDPRILERADDDVGFEDTRETLRYRVLHQDVFKPAKAIGRVHHAPNNDLGKQIKIGGKFQDLPLELVGSDWMRYENKGWVSSGWLYVKPNASHSVAFFKIHLWDQGNGYIHILDAANPPHTVWLETGANFRKEEPFCWNDPNVQRTALWEFQWC